MKCATKCRRRSISRLGVVERQDEAMISVGGSFHCATLDVRRRGGLKSCFQGRRKACQPARGPLKGPP